MRIILIGPPGSGKGTQALFIKNRYNIPYISVSNILKKKNCCKYNLKIQSLINSGKLVSDNLINQLVGNFFYEKKCYKSFILDGFPRTLNQAIYIKDIIPPIKIDYLLEFQLSDDIIFERILGRRLHPSSGRVYHIKFNPPKYYDKDDITNEPLIVREDDNKDVVANRILTYKKSTIPVISFLLKENKNMFYYKIDSNKQIFKINEEIINILDKT